MGCTPRFTYRHQRQPGDREGRWLVCDRLGRLVPKDRGRFQELAIVEVQRLHDIHRRLSDDQKQFVRDYAEAKIGGWSSTDSVARALRQALEALMPYECAEHVKQLADRYNAIRHGCS